jgi:hypothetical protein
VDKWILYRTSTTTTHGCSSLQPSIFSIGEFGTGCLREDIIHLHAIGNNSCRELFSRGHVLVGMHVFWCAIRYVLIPPVNGT